MIRYLSILFLIFTTVSCKKEKSIEGLPVNPPQPTRQEQLMTAEFLDGQILSEFKYDDFGRLIERIHYAHPKQTASDQVLKRVYNPNGLPIADSIWFLPRSSVFPDRYTIYEYNNKNECITQNLNGGFFVYTLNSIEYDGNGRVKKVNVREHTNGNRISEYTYDTKGNIKQILDPYLGDPVYEFNDELRLNHPWVWDFVRNRNKDKNFCTKINSSLETTTITILEKNPQGNPTKVRRDTKWAWDGSTQTDIYTYMYK